MKRTWLMLSLLSLCTLAVACGAPEESGSETEALGTTCGAKSDPVCKGLATGSVCETSGHCRSDPDYPGSCDCVVPAPPPPPPPACSCSGTALGHPCAGGGTCRVVLGYEIAYCACE